MLINFHILNCKVNSMGEALLSAFSRPCLAPFLSKSRLDLATHDQNSPRTNYSYDLDIDF